VECSELRYPNTRTRTCGDPECSSTRTACSATGTTSTTTRTQSCSPRPPYSSYDPDSPVPILGDGGLGGVITPGDYGSMSSRPSAPRSTPGQSSSGLGPGQTSRVTTPGQSSPTRNPGQSSPTRNPGQSSPALNPRPSSSANAPPEEPTTTTKPSDTALPLPTWVTGPDEPPTPLNPYCFKDRNSYWHSFSADAGRAAVNSLCNTGNVLPPSNTFGFAVKGDDDLLVTVTWAKNQDGCLEKQDVPLRDFCFEQFFNGIIAGCDGVNDGPYFGGAFIENMKGGIGSGCVQWYIGTDSPEKRRLKVREALSLANVTFITDLQELEAIRDKVWALVPAT
jgi:hypothetical protein